MIKVTIGITCFNAQETIERSVNCALAQDWNNLEIIIVDDSSSDKSPQILQKIKKQHPQIKLILKNKNEGYAAALNTIIASANGEYIAFFDDDDESVKERIQKQIQKINAYQSQHNTHDILCYSNRNVTLENGQSFPNQALAIGRIAPEPYGGDVFNFIMGLNVPHKLQWGAFGSCTLMAQKAVFIRYNGFDTDFRRCAEWDFAARAALGGAHFIAVDEPLITQYKTEGVGAEKSRKTSLHYMLLLREKHKDALQKTGQYQASRFMAYARSYSTHGQVLIAKAFIVLACLSSPRFCLNKIKSVLGTSS